MNSEQIFKMALGLEAPWEVKSLSFEINKTGSKDLHIYIGYVKDFAQFRDENGKSLIYDHNERTWRHLNFFQYNCYLHCDVPRVKDRESGKVLQVEVPWARSGSGFTLLFEAFSMLLIECEMPVNSVGKILGVYAQRIWTIFHFWIAMSYREADHSNITSMAIDETSSKRGHNYVTLAVDMVESRVIHAVEGKGAETITEIANYLKSKDCQISDVKSVCIDLSPSFISGVSKEFEDATLVFDRFHVKQLLNRAMDEVRKTDYKTHKEELKGCKYIFLKNDENLSKHQRYMKNELITLLPNIGEAYRLKELFDSFWHFTDEQEAKGFLWYWCDLARESKLQPMIKFANTVTSHWTGITNYTMLKISNGVIEGINSKIQLAKRRARGYRNMTNYINMIYFIAGKLKFKYPNFLLSVKSSPSYST